MGIRATHLEYLFDMLGKTYDHVKGVTMCELGNQHLRYDDLDLELWLNKRGIPHFTTGKNLFEYLCVQHISIDINGEDRALDYDLTKPICNKTLLGRFDVVTSFGTVEHIWRQYECFRNIHRFLKVGGKFVCVVPEYSATRNHGLCSYYIPFFHQLAVNAKWAVISEPVVRSTTCDIKKEIYVCMQRTCADDFMKPKAWKQFLKPNIRPTARGEDVCR